MNHKYVDTNGLNHFIYSDNQGESNISQPTNREQDTGQFDNLRLDNEDFAGINLKGLRIENRDFRQHGKKG
jgi:hypothetical protein